VGLWSRIQAVFGMKINKALDKMEDPAETLDYSYNKQQGLLQEVRRGLAEIATSKQRLKMQAEKLRQEDVKLEQQARQAVGMGRDDLARLALQRRQVVEPQIQGLDTQITQLDDQQAKLQDAAQKLQARIEMFRTQKEALKAQYSASKAQVSINESFTGIGREMNDIGMTLQRTQDRIAQMQARSSALDELIETGALTDYTAQLSGEDDIDRQLRLATGQTDIDAQLAAMKAQISGDTRPQIEDGNR
jgi:phage shock protein A